MEFFRRADGAPSSLGILSGAYHPPTGAHTELAQSALDLVDEVVFVLPRKFPHKHYEKVGFDDRVRMVLAATARQPRFSVAATDGGLFIEIARECLAAYSPAPELWFLCGRDAAERIVNWDYGTPGAFAEQLDTFGLLVADRDGHYTPPPSFAKRIRHLATTANVEGVSSTEVRNRLADGREWEPLVPPSIVSLVREIYLA